MTTKKKKEKLGAQIEGPETALKEKIGESMLFAGPDDTDVEYGRDHDERLPARKRKSLAKRHSCKGPKCVKFFK